MLQNITHLLNSLFGIRGRMSRRSFLWLSFLWPPFLAVLFVVILSILRIDRGLSEEASGIAVLCVMLVGYTPLAIKRLHDLGKSGWWLLATWGAGVGLVYISNFVSGGSLEKIVMYSAIAFIVAGTLELCVFNGNPRPNRFGPSPITSGAPT